MQICILSLKTYVYMLKLTFSIKVNMLKHSRGSNLKVPRGTLENVRNVKNVFWNN